MSQFVAVRDEKYLARASVPKFVYHCNRTEMPRTRGEARASKKEDGLTAGNEPPNIESTFRYRSVILASKNLV